MAVTAERLPRLVHVTTANRPKDGHPAPRALPFATATPVELPRVLSLAHCQALISYYETAPATARLDANPADSIGQRIDNYVAPVLTPKVIRTPLGVPVGIIERLVHIANAEVYRIPDLHVRSVSVIRYQPGQYMRWHMDGQLDPTRPWLGCIIALSDPTEYTGGELQIHRTTIGHKFPPGHGVIIPGGCWHRVHPIRTGTRYALTAFASTL